MAFITHREIRRHSDTYTIFFFLSIFKYRLVVGDVALVGFVSMSHTHFVLFHFLEMVGWWWFWFLLVHFTVEILYTLTHANNIAARNKRYFYILLNVISMESFTQFVILPFAWGMWSFINAVATVTDAVAICYYCWCRRRCFDGWWIYLLRSTPKKNITYTHFLWHWSFFRYISVVYLNAIIIEKCVSNKERKRKNQRMNTNQMHIQIRLTEIVTHSHE